ncbi:MAG: hypothetical protein PHU63_03530 [Candidatus ainarchaeum sp.]|nr:hypothetical protein [Candidatus ainarchaeum sp.]
MKKKLIFIPILLLLIFFGCLGSPDFTDYFDKMQPEDTVYDINVNTVSKNCYCFLCKTGSVPSWPFSILFTESMSEGTCFFLSGCNETTLTEKIEQEYTPMQFMLGMGPRPWDFAYANPFCANSLSFSVNWLVSDGNSYSLPDTGEAQCLLEKNVLPVYILYSNSKAVDDTSAGKIAEITNEKGPVILISEIDFDSTNDTVVQQVQSQILRMRAECPRPPGFKFGNVEDNSYCLIAVAPKMGDYEGLKKVLSDPLVNASVDLVAVGVNSNYLKSSDCKVSTVYMEAIQFSSVAWFNYSKPVIWPYMLFNPEGKNLDGSCLWSQYEVNEAYYEFFGTALPAAINSGVIGAAPYLFYSLGQPTDPLDCPGCGLITIEGTDLQPKEPLFSSWFYGCQKYLPEKNFVLLTLPEDKSTTCNFGFTGGLFLDTKITTGTAAGYYVAEDDEDLTIFSCLSCIQSDFDCTEADYEKGGKCDPDLYNFEPYKKSLSSKCEEFPELDLWASLRGIDPALVRAIALGESGLNAADPSSSYCAVSFPVLMGSGCNPLNVLEVEDPTGVCQDSIHNKYVQDIVSTGGTVQGYNDMVGDPDFLGGSPTTKIKPCAYGLMQIASGYPYTYWEEVKTDVVVAPQTGKTAKEAMPSYETSGFFDAMASCAKDGKFNPFDGTHNACMGTWILKGKWNTAKGLVEQNAAILKANTEIKKKWLTAFLAIYGYAGYDYSNMDISNQNGWLYNFYTRHTSDSCEFYEGESEEDIPYACTEEGRASVCTNGEDDNFIKFVTCCMEYDPNRDYDGYCDDVTEESRAGLINNADRATGFVRLLNYYSLSQSCDYTCGKQTVMKANIDAFIAKYSG